jgi:hypothetical protein
MLERIEIVKFGADSFDAQRIGKVLKVGSWWAFVDLAKRHLVLRPMPRSASSRTPQFCKAKEGSCAAHLGGGFDVK